MGPLGSFLCILYWGSQITFFAYYMGPLRSVSSHTIWGPLSDQFHCLLYAPPPQISFFACYRGATSHLGFFHKIYGGPSDQFLHLLYGVPSDQFLCILFGGPSQISFFSYYMGPLSDQFFLLLYGAPSDQFLRILYGGPHRSVSSPTIWGTPSDQFLHLLYGGPIKSVSLHTI